MVRGNKRLFWGFTKIDFLIELCRRRNRMSDILMPPVDPLDLGIRVKLVKDYAVVCESLERMGIINEKKKIVYPSCYCNKVEVGDSFVYSICHFKEMFLLQDKPSTFNKTDKLRRATITYLLQSWGLVKVKDPEDISHILTQKIGVVKHSEKRDYQIIHKFRKIR